MDLLIMKHHGNRAVVRPSLPPRARNPSSRPWRPCTSQAAQDLQHYNDAIFIICLFDTQDGMSIRRTIQSISEPRNYELLYR
uniref:Uncharacterized protein n=1 Tax=Triticum urartu TaxID=4572 RepID=A0A8R7PBA3_TRIUA